MYDKLTLSRAAHIGLQNASECVRQSAHLHRSRERRTRTPLKSSDIQQTTITVYLLKVFFLNNLPRKKNDN